MSTFWSGFIIVIALGSMLGSLWLLFAYARGKPGETDESDLAGGYVWDDDLREYNNPLPRWWLNLFVITVLFGFGYLILYPGLGNVKGYLGWTKANQLQSQLAAIQQKRAAIYAAFKDKDVAALSRDPSAQSLGRAIFLANCAGCHGADARGAVGFPNLSDDDWLHGGTPDDIVATITHGRDGAMPPFLSVLAPQAVDDLVALVTRWNDPALDPAVRERAMQQFGVTCAACHGPDGKGNTTIGSANLTDNIWLYGGTRERVRETILYGRNGHMPAHENILPPDDIRLVAAYVYGLSHAP